MADRIFPNKYQESGLDSELVFTGINWDTFGQRLAAMEEGEGKDEKKDVPDELMKALHEKYEGTFDNIAEGSDQGHKPVNAKWASVEEDDEKSDEDESEEDEDEESEEDEDSDVDTDEDDEMTEESEMKKKASKIVFTNPAQLSAEAVEAALASGNTKLANTILTARHERRVRLANKIENNIKTAQAHNLKLAQRRAYRENLVKTASNNAKKANTRTAKNTSEFVKAQDLNNSAKNAFAAKAIASGFPAEYVEAMLNTPVAEAPAVAEIKQVMASNLKPSVKRTVVASMIKESELDSANINRCKDYWKNELGYGDPEWVDELFKN
jgi:hypothetical protein